MMITHQQGTHVRTRYICSLMLWMGLALSMGCRSGEGEFCQYDQECVTGLSCVDHVCTCEDSDGNAVSCSQVDMMLSSDGGSNSSQLDSQSAVSDAIVSVDATALVQDATASSDLSQPDAQVTIDANVMTAPDGGQFDASTPHLDASVQPELGLADTPEDASIVSDMAQLVDARMHDAAAGDDLMPAPQPVDMEASDMGEGEGD